MGFLRLLAKIMIKIGHLCTLIDIFRNIIRSPSRVNLEGTLIFGGELYHMIGENCVLNLLYNIRNSCRYKTMLQ